MIEVINSGVYTTIQDLGRVGYRKFGVPLSGAMDAISANLANGLLNNDLNAAVLEITLIGPKLQFNATTSIVITGAEMSPKLNGIEIANYKIYQVNLGDVLSFGELIRGTRCYLAILGGFITEKVLGSKSYYKNITEFSKVEKNQELFFQSNNELILNKNGVVNNKIKFYDSKVIEVFKGPEFDCFTTKEQEHILMKQFSVSNHINRMGYRLNEISVPHQHTIITSHVIPGTVQLTPSGKLIILMKDAQTTGGYPRIFQLTEKSISILAQKKTGDEFKFKLIADFN